MTGVSRHTSRARLCLDSGEVCVPEGAGVTGNVRGSGLKSGTGWWDRNLSSGTVSQSSILPTTILYSYALLIQ